MKFISQIHKYSTFFINLRVSYILRLMIKIASKLPTSNESIFAVMSRMAREYDAINLSQGFPGHPIDSRLIELVNTYMNKGYNQYGPMPGIYELREQISRLHFEASGFEYHPDKEITITAGATQGLYTTISGIITEGDEVVVFEPAYDSYVPTIIANGGKPIYISLKHPDYKIDWTEVNKRISSKTKMIIINNPHNPTGAILTEQDLKELAKVVKGSNIVVLSDEVYQHIVFDQQKHCSVIDIPELRERSIVVGSFGKSLHTTGWKMGYVLAPENLTKIYRSFHQWVVFTVNTPIQYAIADYLKTPEHYLNVGSFLQEKRDIFLNLIKDTKFKAIPAAGTYFQLLDYSDISDQSDIAFSEWMTKEKKVASVPVSVFYHEKTDHKVLRFCFAKNNDELEAAAELMMKL